MQAVEEEHLERTSELLKGRQLGWYMDQHFASGEKIRYPPLSAREMDFGSQNLLKVKLLRDNLAGFQNHWDWTISGLSEGYDPMVTLPSDSTLEALYREELKKSLQFHHRLMEYEREIILSLEPRDYHRLYRLVDKRLELNLKQHGYDHGPSASNPEFRTGNPYCPPKRVTKEDCRSWVLEGTCPRGTRCKYKHDPSKYGIKKRMGKGPERGRTVSRPSLSSPRGR